MIFSIHLFHFSFLCGLCICVLCYKCMQVSPLDEMLDPTLNSLCAVVSVSLVPQLYNYSYACCSRMSFPTQSRRNRRGFSCRTHLTSLSFYDIIHRNKLSSLGIDPGHWERIALFFFKRRSQLLSVSNGTQSQFRNLLNMSYYWYSKQFCHSPHISPIQAPNFTVFNGRWILARNH